MKKAPGFSMIEMLAVLAMIVFISGTAIAGVSRFGRYAASNDLGTFNSFLRSSFLSSVRNNQYLRVVIDMEEGTYWSEKSETPFFISTGEEFKAKEEENKKLLERMESGDTTDPFKDKGSALGMDSIMQKARLLASDEIDNSDYYNYENFIPDRKSLKDILSPDFQKASEVKKFSGGIIVTGFFAYHTPEIITPDLIMEKELEKTVYIYIFPQGRIEPFFLSLGERSDEDGLNSFLFISSDMFMNTKIKPGSFEEEVSDMRELLTDRDEEGKS
ncbi:MAG TPA: type II secretion system protein [bacterium]|nr:type II secretion system protein [bacterium]